MVISHNFIIFVIVNQIVTKIKAIRIMEITKDKITDIFCIIDDFCKEYSV